MGKALCILAAILLVGCSQENTPQQEDRGSAQAVAPPATSPDEDRAANKKKAREVCKTYSDLAAKVMEARQVGVAMPKVMDIYSNEDGSLDALVESIIMDAYDQPRMSVEANQQRQIQDYENDIFLRCMQQTPLNK